MIRRSLFFAGFLLFGGALGAGLDWYFSRSAAMLWGVIIAALGWTVLDNYRMLRLLQWLQLEHPGDFEVRRGVCAEVAARVRRQLRERERAAQQHQSSLDSFLLAMQASPIGVMLLDESSHIEWCNDTAASHFGLNAQGDKLQTVGNLVRDPGFVAYLAGNNFQSSLSMPGRNSSFTRPVTLSVQLHPYGEGKKLLLSRDITTLEQAEAMRRDFVANVSHEIRTPLTVLSGFVETLQTLNLDESERQSYLELMAQQAERMQTLVNDLLTLSKLEGSPLPSPDSAVPVAALMRQVEQDAKSLSQALAEGTDSVQLISVHCAFEGELLGNRSELLSAMSNLVSNAVRYTPQGGKIHVNLVRQQLDAALVFSVTDTGPGIAKEHLSRLTERFYRVDRSRSRETGGTGLGLAIVKHVVQRHGASLLIDSTPGQGSVFSIVFPAQRVRSLPLLPAAGKELAMPDALLGGQ
jgi:two-component system phosphate regulon sensor histidine kinase PhoR